MEFDEEENDGENRAAAPGPARTAMGSRQHPLEYLRSTVAGPGHSDLSESFLVLNANLRRHVAMASMGEVKVSNLDEASLQQFQFYESTLDPSVSQTRDRPLTPGPCRTTPRRSAFARHFSAFRLQGRRSRHRVRPTTVDLIIETASVYVRVLSCRDRRIQPTCQDREV